MQCALRNGRNKGSRISKTCSRSKSVTCLSVSLPKEDNVSDEASSSNTAAQRNIGILVLMTVPLAWGTFEPAVRFVYAIEPAVPGFVFSVAYYLVAAMALSTLAGLSMTRQEDGASAETQEQQQQQQHNASPSLPIQGGIELGTYLFVGNGLQVLGLKTVPSDRAAFLLQLTTIFVPLVQAIIAGNPRAVPPKTWGACFIALAGVAVMGLDGAEGDEATTTLTTLLSSFASLSQGDFMIILAALAYTFHCIRLGRYAKETSAIKLAACKATTETTWSLALVLALVAYASSSVSNVDPAGILAYASEQGREIVNYISTISNQLSSNSLPMETLLPAFGAVLWTGLVTCGYTIYAQSFGQSRVNPTDANLIYTIQPIFTALFAWGLLGETLGPAGYIGGALIGSAVFIVATSDDESESDNDESSLKGADETLLKGAKVLPEVAP